MKNRNEILKELKDTKIENLYVYLNVREFNLVRKNVVIEDGYIEHSYKYIKTGCIPPYISYELHEHTKIIRSSNFKKYIVFKEDIMYIDDDWFKYKDIPNFNIPLQVRCGNMKLFTLTKEMKNDFYICEFKSKKYIVKSEPRFTDKLPKSGAYDDIRWYDKHIKYVSWKVKFIKEFE